MASIPEEDRIIIFTSRVTEYKKDTLQFLEKNHVRYDNILFEMPLGERIVVNDRKPSGIDMAVAVNVNRDDFNLPKILREM